MISLDSSPSKVEIRPKQLRVAADAVSGSPLCALFQLFPCANMWQPHATYISLGYDGTARQIAYQGLINELVDVDAVAKIRHCANTGLVLGSEKLRKQAAVMVE
jgi:hypothetical protein